VPRGCDSSCSLTGSSGACLQLENVLQISASLNLHSIFVSFRVPRADPADADTAGAPKGQASTTLVYSIASDSWSVSAAALTTPRSDNCASAVGGLLYTAGERPHAAGCVSCVRAFRADCVDRAMGHAAGACGWMAGGFSAD